MKVSKVACIEQMEKSDTAENWISPVDFNEKGETEKQALYRERLLVFWQSAIYFSPVKSTN